MGKAVMMAVAAFGILGSYYAMGTQNGMMEAQKRVVDYQKEVLARNAALVGHDRAEQMLTDQFPSSAVNTTINGTYEGVPYTVYVSTDGGAITPPDGTLTFNTGTDEGVILSVASWKDAKGDPKPAYRIKTNYARKTVASSEVPGWMENAITAGGDVTLKGNSETSLDGIEARGDERDERNADIHANGDLHINGNVYVQGFATTAQYAYLTSNVKIEPYYNPTDADPVQKGVASVEIPPFDAAAFVTKMGGADRTDVGGRHISGNEDFDLGGTRENPYVWYVTGGRLEISGNVKFSGYVLFVAEEGFKITGNVNLGEGFDGPEESNIAIYTAKDGAIDLGGNTTLYGQIFAGERVDVTTKGNVDIYGNIVTGGDVVLKGNINLRYRSPSAAFWPNETQFVKAVAHSEW